MPTVLITKGYRFFFYVNDHTPQHIHVEKDRSTAKFFLSNVELVKSKRFNAKEINEIRKIILENLELFKTKWDERFTNN
jgi:5-enolpyruvylshikimate-3-phosphate synthase